VWLTALALAASLLVVESAWGQGAYGMTRVPEGAEPLTPGTRAAAERQLVAGVEILGVPPSRHQEVQKHLHTRKDRDFDPEVVQADVRRLLSAGTFRHVNTYKRDTPDGVVLIFEVFERPRIEEILHIGNRGIGEKKLLKEHGLKKGDPLNAFSVETARRSLEELYHRSGYPKATVSIFEGDRPGDRRVVFLINEGKLQRIEDVEFEGNTIASDERLKTQIQSKPGLLWYFFRGKLDREKLEEDVQKITAYYRKLGFFSARVGREIEFDESGKWATIRFVIDEGPRYIVRNVEIDGVTKFRTEPLLSYMKLKRGRYFHQDDMLRDQQLLTDLYGSIGHAFADIQPEPRFLEEPGALDLVYHVKEGDVFHVGNIHVHIKGDFPHTRETVILNRLSLRHGDLVDMREIRNSERRLKASQLFIANPAEGEPPRIVVRPPTLDALRGLAEHRRADVTVRGQGPEDRSGPAPRHMPPEESSIDSPYTQPPPTNQPPPRCSP
jgi:outer membrane protein insertion porin family